VTDEVARQIAQLGLVEAEVLARIPREHLWPIEHVQPNDWNPKLCTPDRYLGLAHSLKTHGWLGSDIPLLWKPGRAEQYVIINGEHRYRICVAAGFEHYPGFIAEACRTRDDAMALTMAMEEAKARRDAEKYVANLVELARKGRDEELRNILRVRDPGQLRAAAEARRESIQAAVIARRSEEPPRVVSMTMTGPQYVRFTEAMGNARSQLKRAGIACDLIDQLSMGDLMDLAVVYQQWVQSQ